MSFCSDIVRNLKTFECLIEKTKTSKHTRNTMRTDLMNTHWSPGQLWEEASWETIEFPAGWRPKTLHSHHLRPGHRVLMRVVVWIPVSKTVHIIVWVHWCSFVRHGNLPKLGQHGRAGGDGVGAVDIFPLWSAAMLHDLFILGALILKPYFHLKKKRRENAHNCHCG